MMAGTGLKRFLPPTSKIWHPPVPLANALLFKEEVRPWNSQLDWEWISHPFCLPVPLLTWLLNLKFISQGTFLKWRVNRKTRQHSFPFYSKSLASICPHLAEPGRKHQGTLTWSRPWAIRSTDAFPKWVTLSPQFPHGPVSHCVKMDYKDSVHMPMFSCPFPWSYEWYLLLWDEVCRGWMVAPRRYIHIPELVHVTLLGKRVCTDVIK